MRHFHQVTVLAVVVAASVTHAQAEEGWRWARNLEEARTLAAESNRLVLVHFSGTNCPPCQRLEKEVFAQPTFGQSLASQYVGVKINADLYPATARKFRVESWPTDVIITPDGEVVDRLISPRTMAGYTATMAQIASDFGHQSAVAASPYQRPVVSYGEVRSTAPAQQPTAPAAPVAQQSPPQRYTSPVAPPDTANVAPPHVEDRYADYYNRPAQEQAPPAVQPDRYSNYQVDTAAPVGPAAPVMNDRYADQYASQQATAVAPQMSPNYAPLQQQVMAPPAQTMGPPAAAMSPGAVAANPYVQGPSATPPTRGGITQDQLPPGAAPLAMDGHCPVTLVEQQRWVLGDVRWGISHEGRTYLFTSAAERDKFWQQPNRFSPVMAGNDPVLATDHGQMLAGRREHGLFVNGRIYLFVSEESLAQFERNRERYVQSVNRTLR